MLTVVMYFAVKSLSFEFVDGFNFINVGFDEEITIHDLAMVIHQIMDKEFKVEYKPAWSNDTKWRKPSLSKLKSCIGYEDFVCLEDGINKMLKYGDRN